LLKVTIHKVRELGDKTNQYLELIDEISINASKLKRKIGGMDLMKRMKELELKEDD